MTTPCTKEKQIEKIETIAEKNSDAIISMQSDIGYIKKAVDTIQNNHLAHLDEKVENLSNNYLVFKTRVLAGWGFAVTIVSIVLNKLLDKII